MHALSLYVISYNITWCCTILPYIISCHISYVIIQYHIIYHIIAWYLLIFHIVLYHILSHIFSFCFISYNRILLLPFLIIIYHHILSHIISHSHIMPFLLSRIISHYITSCHIIVFLSHNLTSPHIVFVISLCLMSSPIQLHHVMSSHFTSRYLTFPFVCLLVESCHPTSPNVILFRHVMSHHLISSQLMYLPLWDP